MYVCTVWGVVCVEQHDQQHPSVVQQRLVQQAVPVCHPTRQNRHHREQVCVCMYVCMYARMYGTTCSSVFKLFKAVYIHTYGIHTSKHPT